MKRLTIAAFLALCACTPDLKLANAHEGDYGVICQGPAGLTGLQLQFHPVNRSPGIDLLVCDGHCLRPRVVDISLTGDDLTFETRDAWPPQDGVTAAPLRRWTVAFEDAGAHIEGAGEAYLLAATTLAKDASCPAGQTAVEPRIPLAP